MTTEIRSARAMSHMSPETMYLHHRLDRWGQFYRDSVLHALPGVTLLGRVIEYGPMGASQGSGGSTLSVPQDVANVELAYLSCGEIQKEALRSYYLMGGPLEVMARRCGMKVLEFQRALGKGRVRVGGYLAAIE